MTTELDSSQAKKLLRLARETIACKLKGQISEPGPPTDPQFLEMAATFVTLKIKGQLRGCIGSLEPAGSLWKSIRTNAMNAAFNDTRFPPLTADELESIHIDVSILTESCVLPYTDADDLISKLRPGIDGVTLYHGRSGATFLPQVWEQLPTPELFLSHLCRKAGLLENCWREEHPDIYTYQVQCIAEEKE